MTADQFNTPTGATNKSGFLARINLSKIHRHFLGQRTAIINHSNLTIKLAFGVQRID
jgi:hypothetical protein